MGRRRIALFGLAAVGALALGIGAAEVQQRYGHRIAAMFGSATYDDPAVAACEFTRLRGRTPAASEYSRQYAAVDGLVVTIAYTATPLNTRPQLHEYSCQFKQDDDGSFVFERDLTKRTVECTETMKALRAELDSGTSRQRRDEMQKTLDDCLQIIAEETKVAARTLLDEDLALNLVGIYPIKPDQTTLSP